jgi:putative ABC transport system permease protein
VAVSVVLLGGASLFVQMLSVAKAGRVGFAVDGVAMLETDTRYLSASATESGKLYEELRRRVAAIPGVQSALLTRGLPMQTTGSLSLVVQDAGTAGGPIVTAGGIWAAPGYFDLLRIPLLYGRAFDERDRRDTPRVAVVNASMARQYFGVVNAVGRRFRFEQDASSIEVIGVVPDTGTSDLSGDLVDPTRQLLYRSFAQWDVQPNTVLARTSLDAAGLVGAMQRELRVVNAALPVVSAKTMAQRLEDSLIAPKAVATLLGALGALGLCLAGIGLYAVVAFAVLQRAHEIGIRMALGARSREVAWTVAREVVGLVGVGTAVGLTLSLLAILAIRLVTIQTPGITLYRPTADPLALLSIAGFMAMVALAAAYIPAQRAARMDPLAALRHD